MPAANRVAIFIVVAEDCVIKMTRTVIEGNVVAASLSVDIVERLSYRAAVNVFSDLKRY
jgi:hypothetical protein